MESAIFSLGDNLAHPKTGELLSEADRHRQLIRYSVWASEAGFDAVHIGEHHFNDYMLSSPPVVLSAIGERVPDLILSTAVTLVPTLDPVRAAEDYSTLENLFPGRVEIVTGRGNFFSRSYPAFGLDVRANMAGLKLPLESKPLQALVSEPVKPIIDTVVMSNAVHAYVSQSDKGELVIGAGTDAYISYTQKGTHEVIEGTLKAILELYPIFSRLRMLRQWGGIVDICPDASPIISKTSIKGLYFNCGWGTGGFKATPGSGNLFAHTIAKDEPHKLNAAFNINRFVSGDLVDEHGAAAVAH